MTRIEANALYGTLNLLILGALEDGPLHGLAIQRRIGAVSDAVLSVEEGALYPALHRLEGDGLIEAEWGRSENNRRAKFYRVTARGRSRLERERADWLRHARAVSEVLSVRLEDV